jgi:multidrug efflux pump subunit AcrA (membrane-fusion protein)
MTSGNEEIEIAGEVAADVRPAEPTQSRKKTRRPWIAATIVLALGAAMLAFLALSRAPVEEAAAPLVSPNTIGLAPEQRRDVVVAPVEAVDLPVQTAVVGRVDFNENHVTPLFAPFAGRVVRIDAEPGASVRQGQVLAMLDSPDIVALQSDYLRALADQTQAAAAERTASASLDLATRTRERAARLAAVEAIPQRELQEAEVAEARAREDLRRAQSGLAAAQSALAALRRRLEIAGLAVQDIERLEKGGPAAIARLTPLMAPVSGTIVLRNVGPGHWCRQGENRCSRSPIFRPSGSTRTCTRISWGASAPARRSRFEFRHTRTKRSPREWSALRRWWTRINGR